jgi:hypothetical protein
VPPDISGSVSDCPAPSPPVCMSTTEFAPKVSHAPILVRGRAMLAFIDCFQRDTNCKRRLTYTNVRVVLDASYL